MNAAVTVRERVNENERERGDGGCDDWINRAVYHAPHQRHPAVHQTGYVVRLGADEMNLLPISADRLANEVLEVAPVLRGVAWIDDIPLQLNQRSLVGSEARRGFEGGDESIRSAGARRLAFYCKGGTRLLRVEVVD